MQENVSSTTTTPATAERMTRGATPAASDRAGYLSGPLQGPLDDDRGEDQQSYLCSRCRKIDFDGIFSQKAVAEDGDTILFFREEQRVLHNPECAFCQAMQFIYPSLNMKSQSWKRSHPLVATTVNRNEVPKFKDLLYAKGKIALTFAYDYGPSQTEIFNWNMNELVRPWRLQNGDSVGYLAEKQTIDSDRATLPAASVKPHVDFDWIKWSLAECRRSHGACRKPRRGRVLGMRLIDCETRTVVPAPERECTYAALSYVWGTSQNTSEGKPMSNSCHGELPADLPNTIADAMLVALRLNIRYLWCDRYCIRQDPRNKEEADEKHGQIARMCDIYSGASITIVAAAGDGPDYGLPGVSKRRQQPPEIRIGCRTLFATLPNPKTLIDCSKWSTRGWTFQEGLLARRRLVFTDQQVYYQCRQFASFEAFYNSVKAFSPINPYDGFDTPVYPYFSIAADGMPEIWSRIHSYAELALTNEQDILNGFLGILKYYEEVAFPQVDEHARNVAGLLIHTPAERPQSWPVALSVALGWQCDHPGKRRDGFPSWSWIGWHCKGFNRNELTGSHLPEGDISSLSISVEGTDELMEQGELHKLLEARYDLSEAKVLRVTAPSLEARVVPLTDKLAGYFDSIEKELAGDLDNTKKRLAVRYKGSKHGAFINLSDVLFCNDSAPSDGFLCFGIILDEDHPDVGRHDLGLSGDRDCSEFTKLHATTLLVVEKDGGFERIGVSHINRRKLRLLGSTVREFRLM